MSYARKDPAETPGYAQHLTPEAAAWIAERHDPTFRPKKNPRRIFKCRPLSDSAREKAQQENDAWLTGAAMGAAEEPRTDPEPRKDTAA